MISAHEGKELLWTPVFYVGKDWTTILLYNNQRLYQLS